MEKYNGLSERALEQEKLAQLAVKKAIAETQLRGNPIARFDLVKQKPYLEFSDGQIKYEAENLDD
jgi:hypothetical protein